MARGEVQKGILYGANFGRDADTIAGMVGGTSGAYQGVEGLPDEWVSKVTANVEGQMALVSRLADTAVGKAEAAGEAAVLVGRTSGG